MYYILDDNKQPKEVSANEWAGHYRDRIRMHSKVFNCLVSTVFLGLDHQYGNGPPLLFETMVFPCGSWDELYMTRCSTYPQSLWMHIKGCCWGIYYQFKQLFK